MLGGYLTHFHPKYQLGNMDILLFVTKFKSSPVDRTRKLIVLTESVRNFQYIYIHCIRVDLQSMDGIELHVDTLAGSTSQ